MTLNFSIKQILRFLIVITILVFGLFIYFFPIIIHADPYPERMKRVIRQVEALCLKNTVDKNFSLEKNQEFAVMADHFGNQIYYELIDTKGTVGEIGVFIPNSASGSINGELYFGIELQSSYIYILTHEAEKHYVNKNIFSKHMTHAELFEFFHTNKWQQYRVTSMSQLNLYIYFFFGVCFFLAAGLGPKLAVGFS